MGTSDEEVFLILLAEEKLRDFMKPRYIWVRKIFQIRHVMRRIFHVASTLN